MTTITLSQPENTYWHFLRADKCLSHGDEREVIVGETLKVEGPMKIGKQGLHASNRVIDALKNAPGPVVCLVTLGGAIFHAGDKSVARERTALWIFDAGKLLREFGCTIAENALLAEREAGREPDPRLYAAIETTRQYIKGEATEEERDAAYSEASSPPCSAANCTAYWAAYSEASLAASQAAIWAMRSASQNAMRSMMSNMEDSSSDRWVQYAAGSEAYRVTKMEAEEKQNALLESMLMTEYNKEIQS